MRLAFTLLEILVAMALLVTVIALTVQLLVPGLRISARSHARSELQQVGTLILGRLNDDLLSANQAGISWIGSRSGSPAVLALQPTDLPTVQGMPAYQLRLVAYLWDPSARELRRRVYDPVPGSLVTLSARAPSRLGAARLLALPGTPGAFEERLLSRDVTGFTLASNVALPNFGNPLQVTLGLERKAASGAVERFAQTRRISLRNVP